MTRNERNDFSDALVDGAAHDAAALRADMGEAAAMVLVGDVYTLLVCREEAGEASPGPRPRHAADALSPFIR